MIIPLPRSVYIIMLLLLALLPALLPASVSGSSVVAGMRARIFLPAVVRFGLTAEEQRVVDLTNMLRAQKGCQALIVSQSLSAAARAHSQDMAQRNYFAHTSPGPDSKTPASRMVQAGYSPFKLVAENIAAGYESADEVVGGWYESESHRDNLLDCSLKEIGVGYAYGSGSTYKHYWTQDFGTRP